MRYHVKGKLVDDRNIVGASEHDIACVGDMFRADVVLASAVESGRWLCVRIVHCPEDEKPNERPTS